MKFRIEFNRFLKNNYKQFLAITLVLLLVSVAGLFGLEYFVGDPVSSENETEEDTELYTHQFDFFIENPDGSNFNNPSIIFEEIIYSEIYEDIEENHNLELSNETELEQLAAERNANSNNPQEEQIDREDIEYYFRVKRDSSSGRYTFVSVQNSVEDSLIVANDFYDIIANDNLESLSNKHVYLFNEPYFVENDDSIDGVRTSSNQYLTSRNIILVVIGSLAIALIVVVLKEFFSKTINYYFSYDADKFKYFTLIDDNLNNLNSISTIINDQSHALVLKDGDQVSVPEYLTNFQISNDLSNLNQLSGFDEIVVLIHPFETRKQWYKNQLSILNWQEKLVKVIQLNDIEG